MGKDNDLSNRNESFSPAESDANKSFVKKVTSRVSGLLPSSLSKWFSSTESNIRPRDETEEDESLQIEPPTKRIKANDSSIDNYYKNAIPSTSKQVTTDRITSSSLKSTTNFQEPRAGPSRLPSKRRPATTKAALTVNRQIPKQGETRNCDNNSESGESTSGYSSMRVGSKEHVALNGELLMRNVIPPPEKTKTLFSTSSSRLDRSLFNDAASSSHVNTSLSTRQPTFNSSAFGSPNFLDRTLSSKRILDSPFYSGRTAFGGASAYARRLAKRSPDGNPAVKNTIQIRPMNESSSDNTLSKTARRILDTLEQYTSPIADARKIPNPPKKHAKYSHVNPYSVREVKVPSNRELQVPTVPELLKMKLKEKMQNTTVSVRQIANSSKSTLNTEEYRIATLEEDNVKHMNKIKNKISSVRQKPETDETVETVKLPNIELPITTLPVFDFNLLAPSSTASESISSTTITTIKTSEKTVVNDSKKSVETQKFELTVTETSKKDEKKFEQNRTENSATKCSKRTEYIFSDPDVISENQKHVKAVNNFVFSEPISTKNSEFSPSLNSNEDKDKHNTFIKQTSVVSNAQNEKHVLKNDFNLLDKFKPAENTWECSVCMIRNVNDKTKCVACETPKASTVKSNAQTLGFANKYKKLSEQWECKNCWVMNANDKTKCISCLSLRHPVTNSLINVKKDEFGSQFKMSSDKWECSVCMVRNNNVETKCLSCTTARPTTNGSADHSTVTKVTFGEPKSSFGEKFNPPSNTWECLTCMIRNKNDAATCVACSTPKPGHVSPKEDGFSDKFKKKDDQWECSSCMVRNSADKVKCMCCDSPQPGLSKSANIPKETKPTTTFNFGIVNTDQTFSFGIKPTENKLAAYVPSIFGQQTPVQAAPVTFSFGIKPVDTKIESVDSKVELKDSADKSQPGENSTQENKVSTTTPNKSVVNGDISKALIPFGGVATDSVASPKPAAFSLGTAAKSELPVSTQPLLIFGPSASTSVPSVATALSPTTIAVSSTATITIPATTTTSTKLFETSSSTSTTSTLNTSVITSTTPTFKFGAMTSDKPTFAVPENNTIALFSGTPTSVNAPKFGATNSPAPTFGATNSLAPTFGLKRTTDSSEPPPAKVPLFSFGGPSSGNTDESSKITFVSGSTNSAFRFGQSAPAPSTSGGFNFGSAPPTNVPNPTLNGTFNFGSSASNNSTFNFGGSQLPATAAAPGLFSFGGAPTNSNPQLNTNLGGFNFNTNNPGTEFKPNFNFTTGATPSAFSATPNSSGPDRHRVMRRALRRTQQR